jgi:D-beta-D-heptose 7-phosphate kinase/D-beta-D-heptose 1-phosphate adenosyltransferase
VALNLVSIGCKAWLFGARGSDKSGDRLSKLLSDSNIIDRLEIDPTLPTTTKTRIIANGQQLLRFDEEKRFNGWHGNYDILISDAITTLTSKRVGAVILSDYNKGVLSKDLTSRLIGTCRGMGIPILVDPKRGAWDIYYGANLVKPNLAELSQAADISLHKMGDGQVETAARELMRQYNIGTVLVTMGAKGMLLIHDQGTEIIDSQAREVFDVSGAGDTVVAIMAACLCSGHKLLESARMANVAAGIVVGKRGTRPVTLNELEMVND